MTSGKKGRAFFTGLAITLTASLTADASEDDGRAFILPVTYFPYPPYIYNGADEPSGPHIQRFLKVARAAGLTVSWIQTTVEGETKMLNQGQRAFCSTGKLYTRERARRWQYLPYAFAIVPRSIIVTTKSRLSQVNQHKTFNDLLKDNTLVGAFLGGATYGTEADTFLATSPRWITRNSKSDIQLINMILAGRADYAAVQEMQWHIAQSRNPAASKLVVADGLEAQPAQPIFLACSRDVSNAVMIKLEQALKKLGFKRWDLPKH